MGLKEIKSFFRQQLLDIDNKLLTLSSEAEKQHQIISQQQSRSNKLYYWRNFPNYDDGEINDKSIGELTLYIIL